MRAPELLEPIPPQIANEGAAIHPFDLKKFITADAESGALQFSAELASGEALPSGLMCTSDGLLTGIPAKGTAGTHDIILIVQNDSGVPLTAEFTFTIKEALSADEKDKWWNDLKGKVWEALEKNLPPPEISDLLNRPITPIEIYYLLQKYGFMIIWDIYNLDLPGEKVPLTIEGVSPYYQVYDRGSCIVGVPKDLYSNERTLEDALQTARAMANEVYRRGWAIELSGFDKMIRAAWVELKQLGDKYGKQLEILHYTPSTEDLKIYSAKSQAMKGGM